MFFASVWIRKSSSDWEIAGGRERELERETERVWKIESERERKGWKER